MPPNRAEWLEFLALEVQRRDRRFAFLWAVIVSLVGLIVILATNTGAVWPDMTRDQWLMAAAAGGLGFLFLVEPYMDRFIEIVHPRHSPTEGSMAGLLAYVYYLKGRGLPYSSRLIQAPAIAAQALLAGALIGISLPLSSPLQWGIFVLGAVYGVGLVVKLVMAALPPQWTTWVGSIIALAMVFAIKKVDDGTITSMRSYEKLEAVSPKINPRRPATWTAYILAIFPAIGSSQTLRRLMVLAVLGVLTPAIMKLAGSGLVSLLDVLGLAAATATSLAVARFLLLVYHDRSRSWLEQLRYAVFAGERLDLRLLPLAFVAIENLHSSHFYERASLGEVLEAMRIVELTNLQTAEGKG